MWIVRKRFLDAYEINSNSESIQGKWYPWLQETGWEIFMKRETAAGTPTALWCISWGQAESFQEADIPALKFTCCFSEELHPFPLVPLTLSTGTFATSGGRGWIFQAKSILGVFLPSADKAADTQSFIMVRSRYCWSAHHQRSQHTLCQPWPLGLQVQGQNGDGKSPSLITCRKFYWINEII